MDLSQIIASQASVIGSMLIDEKTIGPVLNVVAPEDFISEPYRKLYYAIRKLFTGNRPVDPVTVLDAMGGDTSADWYELIKGCMDTTPTAANVMAYVPIMRQQARLERIRQLGGLLQVAQDEETARGYIAQLEGSLVDNPKMRTVTMEQGLIDFYERQKTKAEYYSWGLPELDRGLHIGRGKYVLIGGYASHGKTAFGLSVALTMAKKHRVGFYSLETDDGTLHDRLVAHMATISLGRIKRREMTEEDYSELARVSKDYASRKLEIILAGGCTVEDIYAHALSHRYDIIFVDYVQLISGDKRRGRTEEITGVSIALHTKAQTTGITVVGLAQLSRPEAKGKKQAAPRMSDLRESGQLEQDADAVLLLYKEEPDDPNSRRVLSIEKNKEGTVGQVFLSFDGDIQTFRIHYDQTARKQKREEPEYHQVEFKELNGRDPDMPFEEGQK